MKTLTITELQLKNGFRSIVPTDVNFLKHFGATPISGNAGAGKSSLLEVLKWATQGKSALRDGSFFREGEDVCEVLVKIADAKDPAGISFYISAIAKKDGSVDYKFKAEVDGKLKNTKEPIEGLTGITPTRMWEMLSTSLTYGSASFMSENEKVVTDFIIETYPEVADIAKEIQGRIDEKIKDRDVVSQKQVQKGAYKTQLEGLVQPNYINLDSFQPMRDAAITKISQAEGKVTSFEESRNQRSNAKYQEAQNLQTQGISKKDKIVAWNREQIKWAEDQKAKYQNAVDLMTEGKGEIASGFEKVRFAINYPDLFAQVNACVDELIKVNQDYVTTIKPILTIDEAKITSDPAIIATYPEDLAILVNEYNEIKGKYKKAVAEKEAIDAETIENADAEIQAAKVELEKVNADIEAARQSNELWEKFDILDKYTELHNQVTDLRAERNRLYEGIETGVKGLTISIADEDGKRLCFKYDGQYSPEYFGNPAKEPRLLTSYSKSQKVLISALLQCALMKKRAYPLNVLCIDDTGMDNRVYELYDKFAKKNGLLIFVTSTNDKTESDLKPGEILITEGSVLVKEYTETVEP
jgi:hypothetical protein